MTDENTRDGQSEATPDRVLVCSTDSGDGAGVSGFEFDTATGELAELAATPFEWPMYLAVTSDGTRAYVTNRADEEHLVAVEIDRDRGSTTVLDRRSSGGVGPCYVALDGHERFAFTANYDGGTVGMLPIDDDGRLGPPSDVVTHEGSSVRPDRQAAPHPHAAVPGPDDRRLYVPDLGTDRLEAYDIVADGEGRGPGREGRPDQSGGGRLGHDETASVDLPPGTGPRHLAFGPAGEVGYLVGELDSTVTALARDAETGAMTPVASAPTVPPDENTENAPADVAVHPSGEWVYVSNRGHNSIARVAIDDNRLDVQGHTLTGGENPRDIALTPGGEYLLVENRDSSDVATFAVGDDGALSEVARMAVSRPTCLAFVPEAD